MTACVYDRDKPCPSCPWLKSNPVDGSKIPNFDIDKMRGLANTVGGEDGFRPIMACHLTYAPDERPCVGYLAREGWSNLTVRMAAFEGRIPEKALTGDGFLEDLWGGFYEMLHLYEEAS